MTAAMFLTWLWISTTLVGLVAAGQRHAWGWLLLTITQLFVIAYALTSRQPAFILLATAYGVVYFANWLTWKRRQR